MTDFEKVLVDCYGASIEQAKQERERIIDDLYSGELEYDSLENLLMDEYGLEPDYIFDFI